MISLVVTMGQGLVLCKSCTLMATLVMTLIVIMVIGHNMDDVEPGHGDDGEAGWVGQG